MTVKKLIILYFSMMTIGLQAGFDYNFDHNTGLVLKNGAVCGDGVFAPTTPFGFGEVPESAGFNFGKDGGTLMLTCLFANRDKNPQRFQFVMHKDESFLFGITNNKYNFSLCQDKRWSIALIGGEPVPANQWTHLAAVARRINNQEQGKIGFLLEIYVNGERILTKYAACAEPKPDAGNPITLGVANKEYNFAGEIARAAFFDRPLSPAEIATAARDDKRIKIIAPEFVKVAPPTARQLAALKQEARMPLAKFAVDGLQAAVRTGWEPSELEELRPVLALGEESLATAWNASQSRTKLIVNKELAALLVLSGRGCFPLVAVYDRAAGATVFGDKANSWRIAYREQGRPGHLDDYSPGVSFQVADLQITPDGTVFNIVWQSPKMTVTSATSIKGSRVEYGLDVRNDHPERLLTRVDFPKFRLARKDGSDTLLYPFFTGQIISNPTETYSLDEIFPCGKNTMQLRAYYNDQGHGVYVATEDPLAGIRQTAVAGRNNQLFMSWSTNVAYPTGIVGGNDFRQSGVAVVELYKGKWFEAGQLYRRFLEAKAKWWIPELPRHSSPQWFRDNSIWILAGSLPSQNEQSLLYLKEYFEQPFAVHFVHWTKGKRNWPHFNTINERSAQLLEVYHQAGLRMVPYADPRLWATLDSKDLKSDWKYTAQGRSGAVKNEKGEPVLEHYGVDCAVMCPGAQSWQKYYLSVVSAIAGFGFDGVYHDQLPCGHPKLCFDQSHGHLLNDPHLWCAGGFWPLYRKIQEAFPQLAHTGEDAADPYLRCIDGYMCWRSVEPNQVPLFQSVYAGRAQFVGRLYNHQLPGDWESSFAKAAEQLVQAEQLGWVTLGDLEMASPFRSYFKKLSFVRKALLVYFNEARMQAPLKFRKPLAEFTSRWGHTSVKNLMVTVPQVLHSSWQRQDGRQMALFVNVVEEPGYAEPELPGQWWICREDGTVQLQPGTTSVRLAPYGVEVRLLNPAPGEAQKIAATLAQSAHFPQGRTLRICTSVRQQVPELLDGQHFLRVIDALRYQNCHRLWYKYGNYPGRILLTQENSMVQYENISVGDKKVIAVDLYVASDGGTEAALSGGEKVALTKTGKWFDIKPVRLAFTKPQIGKIALTLTFTGNSCRYKGIKLILGKEIE